MLLLTALTGDTHTNSIRFIVETGSEQEMQIVLAKKRVQVLSNGPFLAYNAAFKTLQRVCLRPSKVANAGAASIMAIVAPAKRTRSAIGNLAASVCREEEAFLIMLPRRMGKSLTRAAIRGEIVQMGRRRGTYSRRGVVSEPRMRVGRV